MRFEVSEQVSKQARHPHELFLINLITNHIMIFIIVLGLARTYPWGLLVTPVLSLMILAYLLYRAKRSLRIDDWYVMCHWQLCAKRSKFFIGMLIILGLVITGVLISVGGDVSQLKPGHYAASGVAMFPTLLIVLILIVMESDAVHKAKIGELPDWLVKKYPHPDSQIESSESS